ncbi:MAG: histidine phosphatase family protein [Pseudomonadota bacterium]
MSRPAVPCLPRRAVVLGGAASALAAAGLPGRALADAALAQLAEPRTHALMRHALAPGSGDPADFSLDDCATQRNLSDLGRAQARRAGDMLRASGMAIDAVWSSAWCRCRETAELMALGPVETVTALNSFSRARHTRPARLRGTREALAALPDARTVLMVSHNVNIEALTGTRPINGEIQVVRVAAGGRLALLARVEVPLA